MREICVRICGGRGSATTPPARQCANDPVKLCEGNYVAVTSNSAQTIWILLHRDSESTQAATFSAPAERLRRQVGSRPIASVR